MSATAAVDAGSPAKPKGKSKLMLIVAVLLVLLGAGGGGAFYIMKKNVAAASGENGEEAAATHAVADKGGQPPTYLALDPFVVNLTDKDSERYAQISVTLEIDDPKFADRMKSFMPAVRNGILMVLAHKSSRELLERSGKDVLAEEIMREAVRPLGIEIDPEDSAAEKEEDTKKKRKKRRPAVHNPVTHVHFANFIVQ